MKCYKIVFSPTGGTRRVADALAQGMGGEPVEVDLASADFSGLSLEEDAVAVIAAPSYGGRVPQTAIDRLKTVQGKGAKAVVVAVYGNRAAEDTLIGLADTAEVCGFRIIAGVEAVAEHCIARQYATGRPDADDVAALEGFGMRIMEKTSSSKPSLPGNRPYKKAGPGLVPKATSACGGCGLCARKCPVGAIDKDNPKRVDKSRCINCMRCVAICPQKARKVNSLLVKIIGWVLKKPCRTRKENKLYL